MTTMKSTTSKRTQSETMSVHLVVPGMYRRLRLPWMFCGLLPSILLDFFLLFVVFVLYPQLIAAQEMLPADYAWESAKVFLVNALLLKSPPIYWYFALGHLRARSYIRTEGNEVVYLRLTHERTNVGLQNVHFYHVFSIRRVTKLRRRKDGAVVIQGEILVKKFNDSEDDLDLDDESKLPYGDKTQRLVLPGYFIGMDDIYTALQSKCKQALL